MRSTRRWWRAHRVDRSLGPPLSTESAIGKSRDRAAIFGGGHETHNVGYAALPENPHAGTIPAVAAARGQSHAGDTFLRCAEPPPDWLLAQAGGVSSASTGGHPAKDFRCTTAWRPRAHPYGSASGRYATPNQTVQP